MTLSRRRNRRSREPSRSRSRPRDTLTNNLYQLTLLNSGPTAVRDIAGNNIASNAWCCSSRSTYRRWHKNLFVEEASQRHHPATRQLGKPVRDDRRGHEGGGRRRRHGGAARRVPGTGHDEAVRASCFRRTPASTDSTVFTTSTGDALSTIIRAPFVATPARRHLRHDHRVRMSRASPA